ncbi:acetate kinase [Streptococcus pneumoniae]|nr:acetate kinase [Streptococcus pneumoniae]
MTKTIAINAGSSSLKWQLYLMPEEKVLAKGLIERIGLKDSISTVKFDGRSEQQILDIENHIQAVKILLDDLFVSILSRLMTRLQVLDIVLLLVENISKNQQLLREMF